MQTYRLRRAARLAIRLSCAFPAGMRARQLIDGAAFGPDRVIGQAFDAAWKEIAPNFGDDQQVIDAARLRLANAVLSLAI
jgi:hypothetical protein